MMCTRKKNIERLSCGFEGMLSYYYPVPIVFISSGIMVEAKKTLCFYFTFSMSIPVKLASEIASESSSVINVKVGS